MLTNEFYFKEKYDEIVFETQCEILHNMLECYEKEMNILEYFYKRKLPLTNFVMEVTDPNSSQPQQSPQNNQVVNPPQTTQPAPQQISNQNNTTQQTAQPNANNNDNRNIFQKLWDGICKLVKLIGRAFQNFFNTFRKNNEQIKRIQDTLNQMDDATLNQVETYFAEISKSETPQNRTESFEQSMDNSIYQEAIGFGDVLSGADNITGKISTGRRLIRTVTNAILTKKTLQEAGKELVEKNAWEWVLGAIEGNTVTFVTDKGSQIAVKLALSTLTLTNPIVGVGVNIIMSYLIGKATSAGIEGIKQISHIFKAPPQSIVPKTLPTIDGLVNAADDLDKTAQSFKEIMYGSLSRNNMGNQMKAQGTYFLHTNLNKSGENMLNQLDNWIVAIRSRDNTTGEGQIVNLDINATPREDGGLNISSGKDITQMNQSQLNVIMDCLIASKTWTYSDQSTVFGQKMKKVSDTYKEIDQMTDESQNPNARNKRTNSIGIDSDDDMSFKTNFSLMKQHGENCLKFVTDVQTIKTCADQIADVYAIYLAVILAGIQSDRDNVSDNLLSDKTNRNMRMNGQDVSTDTNHLQNMANNTAASHPNALTQQQSQQMQKQLNRNLTLKNLEKTDRVRNVERKLHGVAQHQIT